MIGKKKALNRLLSLVLVAVMCISFIPVPAQADTGATLTNGMPVTEENVLDLIEEYRKGKEPGEKAKAAGFTSYAPKSTYDAYEPKYRMVLPSGPINGIECAKFAFAFLDDIFGTDAPIHEVADPADVKPGDLLWSGTHWSIAVQAAYTNKYQEICSQTVGGGPTGLISWGAIEEPVDNLVAIYSKYPLPWMFDRNSYRIPKSGNLGTPLDDLDLDSEAHLYATRDGVNQDFFIPIVWDETGEYSPWKKEQTISGRLDISDIPELADSELPIVTADITLEGEIGVSKVEIQEPGTKFTAVGTAFEDLNLPSTLPVIISYENNEEIEAEDPALVYWVPTGYDPLASGEQTITGIITIPDVSILNTPDFAEWKATLPTEISLSVYMQKSASEIEIIGNPFEAAGYLGNAFSDLEDVPQRVPVMANFAAGVSEEYELPVYWDTDRYDPLASEQDITGRISLGAYPEFNEFPADQIPTATLRITLARDPGDAVSAIALITPLISGTKGIPFEQQNFPETVSVRITYDSGYQEEVAASVTWIDNGFDPNTSGTQDIKGILSFAPGVIPNDTASEKLEITASVNVQVRGTGITLPEITPLKGYLGADVSEFQNVAPKFLKVAVQYSSGETDSCSAGVTWDWSEYDPTLAEQVIHGMVVVTALSSFEDLPSPDAQLVIYLTEKPAYAADFEKVYDGKKTALPVDKPEGCTGAEIVYEGDTLSGIYIKSSTAPTEAGTYTAAVTLTMLPGYPAVDSLTVKYIINQAEQPFDAPVKVAYTTNNTIGVSPVTGAEYRINDGEWQDSPTFEKLTPGTTYTISQRLKASADMNKKASAETSTTATTQNSTFTGIAVPFAPKFTSKVYDGAGLLDSLNNGTFTFDFAGTGSVRVSVKAYLSNDCDITAEPQDYDAGSLVKNPTSVGPYVIVYELSSPGYVWADNGSTKMESGIWITPKFSDIYVGDQLSDVTMEGGVSDANSSSSTHRLDFVLGDNPTGIPFDTSCAGKTMIPVGVHKAGSVAMAGMARFSVEILPWVITGKDIPTVKMASDAAFDASLLPSVISVTANAREKEQAFEVPVTWDTGKYNASLDTQTIPGTLDFSGNPELNGSEDTSVSVVVTRMAAPVYVPADNALASRTYNGTGLFDNGKDCTIAVGGADVPVQRTAYLAADYVAVENPTAAGRYVIRSVLPEGYFWEGTASQEMDTALWIYPTVSPVYVGERLDDASLTTGNGVYDFQFGANPGFSSGVSGTTKVSVIASCGDSTETITLDVDILPWEVTGKKPVEIVGELGTDFSTLTKPGEVVVTAKGNREEREFNVPVVWSAAGYNALTGLQTINGTLDFSGIPELAETEGTVALATVRLSMKVVLAPIIAPFSKTFDGGNSPLLVPMLPTGMEGYTVSYTGTTCAGASYGPASLPPVNAGEYTAIVTFTMSAGCEQTAPAEVSYTITQAAQASPGSIGVIVASYDSIVLVPVDGAEYSKDGVVWQSSNAFYGLTANTEYTMYVRMPASADGNYAPSEALSMPVVTEKRQAQPPALAPRTVTYTGEPQAYTVAAITGVQEAIITYAANGTILAGAPVNAGEYDVSITYRMENGYKQLDSMTSKLAILKAPQTAPVAAVTGATDTTLTISNLSGAEYSINGGRTWQFSHRFIGLERNTQYTVLVRLAEDENHATSPAVEVRGYTTTTTSEVPSMLPAYTVAYDGTAKEYIYAANLSDIEGVQSVTVTYSGTTNAGAGYRSTTPPTEAGQYAVTISLTARPDYSLPQALIGTKLTIERAPQSMIEAPTIARVTTATVTVNPIAGAEYSGNNGATWQTANSFTGLAPQTSFVILVRLAETPNYLASETYSLPAQTLANTGLTYDIDFRKETIQFNEQVVEMSLTSFFNGKISSGSPVTPGLMLFARLVDNGAGSVGTVNNISIPACPAAPDVKYDPTSYTLNTTAAMEYSADSGETWTACGENMDVAFLGGYVLLIRYAATNDSFHSDVKNIFVPIRPEAPSLTINLVTERINTTSAMEYSSNGGASWQPCQIDMSVGSLTGETIMVRKKATATSPASTSAFLNIPDRADAPEYSILMSAEQLTANVPFEYYLNGKWTEAETLRLSDLSGQTILIQAPAGEGKFASSRISVPVPMRGEIPVVEIEEQTLTISTTIDMEYSITNGVSWNPAVANMDISVFAGKAMLIRRAVTETMFASNPAVVHIRSLGKTPDVGVDTVREIMNTTAEMEYSTDAGKTWIIAPDELDVSNLTGGSLAIRMRGTETEFPSESITVSIPSRNEAPKVSVDLVSGLFDIPAGTQYSPDGGENWMDAPVSIMESMYGMTLLFRTPADAAHFASISVLVALPSRSDGPAVAFDMKNLTVNTSSDMEYSSDGGYTWTPAPNGLVVSGLLGKTVMFRYAASEMAPASSSTALELPIGASVPVVSVDCVSEQMIASEFTLEWSQDNGHTWSVCKTPMNAGEYAGRELLFRAPGTTETPASASVPVTIPGRESNPEVDVDTATESINTTPAMEYSLNGGLSWMPAPINLDVSNMTGEAVLVRTAHTDNSFASLAVSVTVPSRASAVTVSVNMEKETLNTSTGMDYSLDNGRTWTQAPAGLNVSGMTGSVVLVRSHGSGFQFASELVSVSIPIRRETPKVYADLRSELFSVSDGAVFSSDSGKTWADVPVSITSDLLGSTVLFRFPADENQFASAPAAVTLPARPDGPTISLDREMMTVNTTSDMEFCADEAWTPAPDNMDVSGYQGKTLQFRYAAYDTFPASSITELMIPAVTPAPVLSLDITNERIVSNEEGAILEYSEDGGETWNPCVMPMDIGGLAGKEIIFRIPADGEAPSSVAVVARIPDRAKQPAAALDVASETVLVGPAEGLSYSADGGETWSELDGVLSISGLTGATVLVRVSCTTEKLASEPVAIIVPTRNSAPATVIDMTAETLAVDSSMEFSVDGGETWTFASEDLSVSGMAGAALVLRYAHTETELHSEAAIIAVPERLKAPEVSADMRSGKFSVPEGVEFSSDGGRTWGDVPDGIGEDLLGKTVLFRLPATEKYFASAEAILSLPARPDGPVLSLNKEALTVNTDASMEYSTDNGATWQKSVKNMSVADMLGMTLAVRYAATKGVPVSSETVLVIPTRNPAPSVQAYNVTAYGRNDGIIMGTDTSMEYRRASVASWTKVTGSSIGFLSAGTYEIRYAATDSSIASEIRTVVICSPVPDQTNPGSPNSNPGGGYPGDSYPGSSGPAGTSNSKSYTVKFDSNGGSTVKSQNVDKNGYAEMPDAPVRGGYAFRGWYSDAKLTKFYDFESKVKSNITLYAKWEEISAIDPGYVDPTPVVPDPIPDIPPVTTKLSLVEGDIGISYVNGRAPGKFEPNAGITRGEVAVILYRLMSENAKTSFYSQNNDFMDVASDSWYNEEISTLVQAGVLGGYGDGTFHPDQPVTRAELAAILVRVQGGSASAGDTTFSDTDGHWAEGYISSAVTSGLVFGYEDGTFKPNRSITRAEAVTMMNRLLMRSPINSADTDNIVFIDVQPSDWFYGNVMAAANGYLG